MTQNSKNLKSKIEFKIFYNNNNNRMVFNRRTNNEITRKTANLYLTRAKNPYSINDFIWDKKKYIYNPNSKRLVVSTTEYGKDLIKKLRFERREAKKKQIELKLKRFNEKKDKERIQKLLARLPAIYKQYKYAVKFQTSNTSTPELSFYGISRFTLTFTNGGNLDIINKIIEWVNNKRGGRGFQITIATGANNGYFVRSGIIQGRDALLTDITAKLDPHAQSQGKETDLRQSGVEIRFYAVPQGASMGSVSISPFLKGKTKSVCLVKNKDNRCGQICLMLGLCKTTDDRYNLYKRKDKTSVKKYNKELKKICDVMGDEALSLDDFDEFVNHYQDYNILIWGDNNIEYKDTQNDSATKTIHLFYDRKEEHYHFINNIQGFVGESGRKKYCEYCRKIMTVVSFKTHTCSKTQCKTCLTRFDTDTEYYSHLSNWVGKGNCSKCNYWCRNTDCLDKHEQNCKNKDRFWECCYKKHTAEGKSKRDATRLSFHKKIYDDKHNCDYTHCINCNDYKHKDHRCYIQPRIYKDKGLVNIYCFDMESYLENISDDDNILDEWERKKSHKTSYICCKGRLDPEMRRWEGDKCLEEFVGWALQQEKAVFVAHNGKAYDTWLIHHHLNRHTNKRPSKIILAGSKIMYMKIESIEFIDSINHFGGALEDAPNMWGLDTAMVRKGYYPYYFNTYNNRDYVGELPSKEMFGYNFKKDKWRKSFDRWYNEAKENNYVWRHNEETKLYCENDVEILLECCNAYSKLGYEKTGIDPLRKQTVASWVMEIYLTHYYPYEDYPIAVLKEDEYKFIKSSFSGGRTETIRLAKSWTCKEILSGIYGKYIDIQSLYPTVQHYDELPYDIPEWVDFGDRPIEENHKIINENYGYFEVDVEMNKQLFIPPLVGKVNGKLTADLIDKYNKVFHSEELRNAIIDGCKITKIHKLLRFKHTDQLFKKYVRKFLEIKVNASGQPHFWGQQNNRKKFIEEHQNRFGFTPTPDKEKNNGLRALAKLMLNSLWGKFGQRPDLPTSEYINPKVVYKWYNLLKQHKEGKIELKAEEVSGECLYVKYIKRDYDMMTSLNRTNLGIASSITACARMRLYKELRLLKDRVLYYDTDSIIYEYNKNLYNVVESEYLGGWECETTDNGVFYPLSDIVSIGAKSYAYKTVELVDGGIGKRNVKDCKMKGICLNFENNKHINFDGMMDLVNGKDKLTTNHNLNFKKTKAGIITEMFDKEI